MEKPNFGEAVKIISNRDLRFKSDGYYFLKDSLEQTVKRLRPDELEEHRHVSGAELVEGLVEYALSEFGSMAVAVLESWGITRCEDVGAMVFQLIEAGAFGRSEEDSPGDFAGVLDLREELIAPFRPTRPVLATEPPRQNSEPPARGNQPAKPSEI